MCRNCVHFPESGDVALHVGLSIVITLYIFSSNIFIIIIIIFCNWQFVKTILSQGYLVPVPLSVCPVYWSEGAALTVYPLPDVLVIADQRSPFNITHKECVVFNPVS